jgi:hypothetical protein
MRINSLASTIRTLGESLDEPRIVKKFLRVVPSRYSQIAVSIEILLDLDKVTVEELVGWLRASQDRFDEPNVGSGGDEVRDKFGRLMMAEEDWFAKWKHKLQPDATSSSLGGQPQGKAKGGARTDEREGTSKLTLEGTLRRKGRCRKPKKEKARKYEAAHLAKADVEQPALLLAAASTGGRTTSHVVHLQERNVDPSDYGNDDVWYLDTGASNHMTRQRTLLARLDESVGGTVRFGDGSVVEIHGLGAVVMKGRQGEHKVLTSVYFIPKLKSNIVSVGQLEEAGCEIVLGNGKLCVYDRDHALLVKAPRTTNRLYMVKLDVAAPVCLLSKADDVAWLWHARYGHLNFRALRDLGVKEMVEGIPVTNRIEQVCDGCTLGKQHRVPFPRLSTYRVDQGLDVLHADLCGQITPPTPGGGGSYFLLVVDDYSRHMWVEFLASKDQALYYIKKIKASAETELGRKLRALRTDRGGEFNSNEFTVFSTEFGIKHHTTTPYSPQQNGVVERRNQTVI